MDISKLDKETLNFAIQIAWAYGMNCKTTKEGRTQKECFDRVEKTLKHYLEKIEQVETVK